MSDFLFKTKKIILVVGDIALLYLALYLTLITRYNYTLGDNLWGRHIIPFSLIFIVWLVVFFINDFYDLKTSYNTNNLLNLLLKVFIINGAIAVILFYFAGPFIDTIKPQRVLIIDLIYSFVLIFFWRRVFFKFIKSSNIANKVLVVGKTPLSDVLVCEINRRQQLGYQALNIEQTPENLKSYCRENKIDILVSAERLSEDSPISKKIFDCLSLGIDVYNITSFYEQIVNKIPVEYIDHSWFLDNLSEHSKKTYEVTKRVSDIILAIFGLIITAPIVPIIALAIKLNSPGPVIFKQTRTGKNGKEFLAMKFRSMVRDSEKNGAQWTHKNDPRITRVGQFIRKTRLDEIPQLINILRGEMSFIGPRPEQPEFVKTLNEKIPFYKERLIVKPGLGGWAQLNAPHHGASEEDSLEKIKYDLYYIKNRSIFLDLSILLKTIKVVFTGKGQ